MKVNNTLLNMHRNVQRNSRLNQSKANLSKTHQIWTLSQVNKNHTIFSQSRVNQQQKSQKKEKEIDQESSKDSQQQNMTSSCASQSRYSEHIQNLQSQNLKIKVEFYKLRLQQSIAECQNLKSKLRVEEQHNQKLSFQGQQNIKRFELYIKDLIQEIRQKDQRIVQIDLRNKEKQDFLQQMKAQIRQKCEQIYQLSQINKKITQEAQNLQTNQLNRNQMLLSKQKEIIIQKDFTIQQFQMLLFSKDNEINILRHERQLFLQKQKNMENQLIFFKNQNMNLNKYINELKEQLNQKKQDIKRKEQEQKRCQSVNQIKQVINDYSSKFQQFQQKTQKQKKQAEKLNQKRSKEQSSIKYIFNLTQQNKLYCIYNQNLQRQVQKLQAREMNLEQNIIAYEDKFQNMEIRIQELLQMVEKRNQLIKELKQSRQNLLKQIKNHTQMECRLRIQNQNFYKNLQWQKQSQRMNQNEKVKLRQALQQKSRTLELRQKEISQKQDQLASLKKEKAQIMNQKQKDIKLICQLSEKLKNVENQGEAIIKKLNISNQKMQTIQKQSSQLKIKLQNQIPRLKKELQQKSKQSQSQTQYQNQKISSKKYIYEPLQTKTKVSVFDDAKTLKIIKNQKLSQQNIQKHYNRLSNILQQINQNYNVFQALMNQQQSLKVRTLNSININVQQNKYSSSIDNIKTNPYASIDRLILLVRQQQTAYQNIQQKLKHKYSKTQQIPQLAKGETKLIEKQSLLLNEKQKLMRAKSQESIPAQIMNWRDLKINREGASPYQYSIKCSSQFELSNSPYRKFQTRNVQFSKKNINKQSNQQIYQPCSRNYLPQY